MKRIYRLLLVVSLVLQVLSCTKESDNYQIVEAYALIHDQGPVKPIKSVMIGTPVSFDGIKIDIKNESHKIDQSKTQTLSISEFENYTIGMNYDGLPRSILGINTNQEISVMHYIMPPFNKDKIIGDSAFYCNGYLLLYALKEFETIKDWSIDEYFYLAKKVK